MPIERVTLKPEYAGILTTPRMQSTLYPSSEEIKSYGYGKADIPHRHYAAVVGMGTEGRLRGGEVYFMTEEWHQCCATMKVVGVALRTFSPEDRYSSEWSAYDMASPREAWRKMGTATALIHDKASLTAGLKEMFKEGNEQMPLINLNALTGEKMLPVEMAKGLMVLTAARHALWYASIRAKVSSISAMTCAGSDLHLLMDTIVGVLNVPGLPYMDDVRTGNEGHTIEGFMDGSEWFYNRNGGRKNKSFLIPLEARANDPKALLARKKLISKTTQPSEVLRFNNLLFDGYVRQLHEYDALPFAPFGMPSGIYTTNFQFITKPMP